MSVDVNDTVPSTSNTIQNNTKQVKKTGFALYKSYNEQIPTKENALRYLLIEKSQLTNLVGLFACPDCLSEKSMTLMDGNVKGYVNTCLLYTSRCV